MFDQSPVGRRLAMCADALALRERMTRAVASKLIGARVLTKKRLEAIRRALLGRRAIGEQSLSDELLTPSLAIPKLRQALDAARDGTPEAKTEAAMYVTAILNLLRAIENAERDSGLVDAVPANADLAAEASALLREGDQEASKAFDVVIDASMARGRFDADAIAQAAASPVASKLRIEDVSPDLARELEGAKATVAAAWDRASAICDAMSDLAAKIRAARLSGDREGADALADQYLASKEAYNNAYAEYAKAHAELIKPAEHRILQALKVAKDQADEPRAELGRAAIASLMDASGVAEDKARAWADAQEITKTAQARLKKINYPIDQVRADMAEFYRITGGRVSAVRLHSKGDRRANATAIESHGQIGTINMDGDFDKRTLWHEMGHHIEADPVAKAAAGRMIRRRAENGGATYSLRSLTGSNGYRADEKAFKDGFFSPYVGKVYRDGATEVFSMGIESFSSPAILGKRMTEDPATLEFVAGFLRAEQSPLCVAFRDLRDALRDINTTASEEGEESQQSELAALYERIGASVTYTPGGEISPELSASARSLHDVTFAGRFSEPNIFLFAGKVRNPDTGRRVNGLIVVRYEDTGAGWYRTDETYIPSKDLLIARVAAAIGGKNRTSRMPRYFELTKPDFLKGHA